MCFWNWAWFLRGGRMMKAMQLILLLFLVNWYRRVLRLWCGQSLGGGATIFIGLFLVKVSLPGDTQLTRKISVANIRGSFRSASIPSKGCKSKSLTQFFGVGLSEPVREKISTPSWGSFWLTLQCSTTKPQITPLLVKSFTILKQRELFGAKGSS